MEVRSRTTTLAGVSARRVFVRVAVTVMVSAVWARRAAKKQKAESRRQKS
jgi:hypothetical protein